jgi:hypothetical protein
MPLNVTYFADPADVREKATSVLDVDFPEPEIIEEQENAVDHIKDAIGEYDQNHPRIRKLKNTEVYFAASFILDNHSGSKDDVDRLYNKAETWLQELKKNLTGTGQDVGFLSTVSPYTTRNAARVEDLTNIVPGYKSTTTYVSLGEGFRDIEEPSNPKMDSNAPEDLMNQGASKIWY